MPPKKVKVMEEPMDEAPKAMESPPEPTFEKNLAGVWAQEDLVEQRRLAAALLGLTDGPSHSLQAMGIDDALSHILLARQANMNVEQAKVLLEIMQSIKDDLADESTTMADTFTTFKGKVMDNCDLRFIRSEKQKQEDKVARAKAEAEAAEAATKAAVEVDAKKGGKKDKKVPAKGAAEEEEAPKALQQAAPKEDPHFTTEQIKIISDYVTTGVFGHYKLQAAVFGPQFSSRKNAIEQVIRVETPIPDGLSLAAAVEIIPEPGAEEVAEQEAEKTAQTIAALVAARLKEAQTLMANQLKENEEMLEARLKTIEGKLTGKKSK